MIEAFCAQEGRSRAPGCVEGSAHAPPLAVRTPAPQNVWVILTLKFRPGLISGLYLLGGNETFAKVDVSM